MAKLRLKLKLIQLIIKSPKNMISINLHSLSLASSDESMDNIFLKLNLLKNVFTLSQRKKIIFKYKGRVIFRKQILTIKGFFQKEKYTYFPLCWFN